MITLSSTLNPEQIQATRAVHGRILVLAGAGSGKTSVLTARIAHLINSGSCQPDQILGLTFTNKAAGEMRERVAKQVSKQAAKLVTLCTFHSFCMAVLRAEIEKLGYTKNFSLYDEGDIRRMITNLAKESLEHEKDLPSLGSTMEWIREAKMGTKMEVGDSWHEQFSSELFAKFESAMRAYNAVDFDSLLTLTVELFEKFPEVLEKYQDRFPFILIDEFQDTNPIQNRLAELLCEKHGNLFVVGDDDQSIYGWRGAKVEYILDFPADQVIKLEQNYRSTPTILLGANAVIGKNKQRHGKNLWTNNNDSGPIEVFHAPTADDEADSVLDRILRIREERGLKWKDFAILYRSNALARNFEKKLMQKAWKKDGEWARGIPYEIFGGTELYSRAEIKDLMAYLRLIVNHNDTEALLRIINFPRRGISEKTLTTLTEFQRKENLLLWKLLEDIAQGNHPLSNELSSQGVNGIKNFMQVLKGADFSSLHLGLQDLIDQLGYKKAVTDEVKSDKMKKFKKENIESCVQILKEYEEGVENPSLTDFLSSTMLNQSKRKKNRNKGDHISLMTFHSAKGLEYPVCFLIGIEDHLVPHQKSVEEVGLDEERRLFYVAMTRAQERLIISMAQKRERFGKVEISTPSRFLHDIPGELLKATSYRFF